MIILGIDPGSQCTGYGLITADRGSLRLIGHGFWRAGRDLAFAKKLLAVHRGLAELIASQSPDVVVVEQMFYGKNVQSAIKLSHLRGVVLLTAAASGKPIAEYSALAVKSALTGYGRAEKSQVQSMVRRLLDLPEATLQADAADALAVAICHAHSVPDSRRKAHAL